MIQWIDELDRELKRYDWDGAYEQGLTAKEAVDDMARRRMA